MKKILRRFVFCAVLIAALTFLLAGTALLAANMGQMQTGKAQTQVRLQTDNGRWRITFDPLPGTEDRADASGFGR